MRNPPPPIAAAQIDVVDRHTAFPSKLTAEKIRAGGESGARSQIETCLGSAAAGSPARRPQLYCTARAPRK